MSQGFQNQCNNLMGMAPQGGGLDSGWKPMSTAPHDGTIIEVCNNYGIAPYYGLYRWTTERKCFDNNGKIETFTMAPGWVSVKDGMQSFEEGHHFTWRPYSGTPEGYRDPTGGAQDSSGYWLRASLPFLGLI